MKTKTDNSNIIFSKNSFDIIRYFSAFSVMFLHYTGYTLTLSTDGICVMNVLRQIVSFFPGVVVLFSMSGFLIAASFEHSENVKCFFIKRVLRLYPELWICTVVNLVIVIAIAGALLDKSIVLWVVTQIFGIANTPSCLKSFSTGSINGALWTVFTELQLYVVLGLTYRLLKKLNFRKWILLIGIFSCFNVLCDFVADRNIGFIAKVIERTFIPYAIWFLIGIFCYIYREKMIPVLKKLLIPLVIIYTVLKHCPIKIPGYYANIAVGILCPFITIGAGYSLPSIRIKRDITYGIFLYHWIVLNLIVYYDLLNKSWILSIVVYTATTLLLAFLSWKFVGTKSKKMVEHLLSK